MADALRAARIVPGFCDAVRVHLVETSPRLEAAQRRTLVGAARQIAWHRAIEDVPDGSAIVIANEFFDALPVRHYIRGASGWHERVVGLGPDATLRFGVAPEPIHVDTRAEGATRLGQVLEVNHAALRTMQTIAARVVGSGGAILVADYGHVETALGETLQAVHGHAYADVLAAPGTADLTAHVDFGSLARTAADVGASVHGPVAQGLFLRRLGIVERGAALKAHADAAQAAAIDAALARFTAPTSSMASLFKVLAVTPKDASVPAGFEEV